MIRGAVCRPTSVGHVATSRVVGDPVDHLTRDQLEGVEVALARYLGVLGLDARA